MMDPDAWALGERVRQRVREALTRWGVAEEWRSVLGLAREAQHPPSNIDPPPELLLPGWIWADICARVSELGPTSLRRYGDWGRKTYRAALRIEQRSSAPELGILLLGVLATHQVVAAGLLDRVAVRRAHLGGFGSERPPGPWDVLERNGLGERVLRLRVGKRVFRERAGRLCVSRRVIVPELHGLLRPAYADPRGVSVFYGGALAQDIADVLNVLGAGAFGEVAATDVLSTLATTDLQGSHIPG